MKTRKASQISQNLHTMKNASQRDMVQQKVTADALRFRNNNVDPHSALSQTQFLSPEKSHLDSPTRNYPSIVSENVPYNSR